MGARLRARGADIPRLARAAIAAIAAAVIHGLVSKPR